MSIHFGFRVQFANPKNPPNRIPIIRFQSKLLQTLSMADVPPNSSRLVCPSCSKPARVCLCSRLRNPSLDNSVGITILQHSLEKNHPLNSARIVKLGLKNVKIATVSDVHFEARFTIRFPEPHSAAQNLDSGDQCSFGVDQNATNLDGGAAITATIGKYGVINSLDHIWKQRSSLQELKIEEILTYPEIKASLAKGFIVKKVQKRLINGSKEVEEYDEFEIEVPPKSVLLFPSENAFTVDDDISGSSLDVNNLIVLDGTWPKAKRMYNESPWLRLLPHLKLDLEKMSLYCEVRHQPKIGFLSTIESIVYALKAIGESQKGLDDLLDIFESMVEDQRRCKDERIKATNLV